MSLFSKFSQKTSPASAIAVGLLILTFYARGGIRPVAGYPLPVSTFITDTIARDTAKSRMDSVKRKDTLVQKVDTMTMSKDSVDAIIKYHADDSAVLVVPSKEMFLYGKARTDYKDLKMEAATIRFDQASQLVKAYGALDTTGNPMSKPQITQGELKTVSDSITYNLKTGKALTKNTFFQEGEIFVNATYLKKVNADEVFARDARFTTCNLDTPHFAFRAKRMKVVNNKLAVTGRIYPEVESVPIPMVSLPFALFPLYNKVHSGILFPAFTSSEDFGLGLEGLGYYKTFGQHWDATTRANIYSYGGWSLNVNSKYIVRYKYSGSVNVSFQKNKQLSRSLGSKDEFAQSQSYMINWSHTRDNRARPGTNFSANVNFGSTQFNRSLLNNPFQNFNNQLSSSISYSKDWKGKFNLSLNLNHNQNSVTRLVNLSLPNATFNVVTFYPFQPKEQVGTGKWYEKIGVGYSGNFLNQLSFYDSAFNFRRLLDTAQYGAVHSLPITLSLPPLGPFTIAPSISYEERWYGQRIFRNWNASKEKVDTTIQKGFYTARQMSFGMGLNTRIFGTYQFSPKSKVMAIRHEIRPNISLSYHPDFVSKYFYDTQVDTSGRRVRFSQFDGGIIGSFSEGIFGGIGFGIDNLLEMKVKDKNDTAANQKGKKIRILDGFGFNSSYNLLADSFALGSFSIYARSTLFEKLNISASALLDPYEVDSKGYRVNKILWDPKRFKFGRITGGNIAVSTSFSSKSKDGKDDKNRQMPVDPFMTPDEQQRQLQMVRANPAEYTDFNIPWTISLSYSLNFNRVLKTDYSGFTTQTFSSVNFNGDFSLTPKWKVGATGYYDFTKNALQQLSTFISREMHCWQLSINVTPIGLYRSFNISFNPKSGILRDLKINRSRTFTSY
jgi:LPS-assembly protein